MASPHLQRLHRRFPTESSVTDHLQQSDAASAPAAAACSAHDEIVDDHDQIDLLHDLKMQIMAHPAYPRLLSAYINCRKFGAPPEVAQHLEELQQLQLMDYNNAANSASKFGEIQRQQLLSSMVEGGGGNNNSRRRRHDQLLQNISYAEQQEEELDKFMNAYADVLQRYHEELSSPFYKAMAFLHSAEAQLSHLLTCNAAAAANYNKPCANIHHNSSSSPPDFRHPLDMNAATAAQMEKIAALKDQEDACGSVDEEEEELEEDETLMMGEVDSEEIDPIVEDQKLKQKLFQKYRGHIQLLRQQFMRKRKKGKLPKESRQKLLEWWNQHYKWPYPTEAEKTTLAEASGLDPKQINNWFINQRKRHWKPTEDMKFHVLVPDSDSTISMNAPDAAATTNIPAYY